MSAQALAGHTTSSGTSEAPPRGQAKSEVPFCRLCHISESSLRPSLPQPTIRGGIHSAQHNVLYVISSEKASPIMSPMNIAVWVVAVQIVATELRKIFPDDCRRAVSSRVMVEDNQDIEEKKS